MAGKIIKEFPYCIGVGSSKSIDIRTHGVKFGDGYETTFSFGINNASKSWSCTKTDTKAVIDIIEAFIIEHKNVDPFYMTIAGKRDLYKAEGGISVSQESGSLWNISFTVKQSFKP